MAVCPPVSGVQNSLVSLANVTYNNLSLYIRKGLVFSVDQKLFKTESYLFWSCKQLERAVIFRIDEAHKNKLDKPLSFAPLLEAFTSQKNGRCKVRFLANSNQLCDYHLTGVVTCVAELVINQFRK